jgi:hypothetical protein
MREQWILEERRDEKSKKVELTSSIRYSAIVVTDWQAIAEALICH